MQRAVIVSGVLGLGSVLVFAAALAAALFPNGGTVNAGWNSWGGIGGGRIVAPAPMPAIEPGIIDDGKDDVIGLPQPVEDR